MKLMFFIVFCCVWGDHLETMCFVVFQAELHSSPAPGPSGFPMWKPHRLPGGFPIGRPQGGLSVASTMRVSWHLEVIAWKSCFLLCFGVITWKPCVLLCFGVITWKPCFLLCFGAITWKPLFLLCFRLSCTPPLLQVLLASQLGSHTDFLVASRWVGHW